MEKKINLIVNKTENDLRVDIFIKKRENDTFIFDSLNREKYLYLLKNSSCIVGNSSSGLIEAPTFKIPCVNIGRRQNKRLRAKNVIDVINHDKNKIIKAITRADEIKVSLL